MRLLRRSLPTGRQALLVMTFLKVGKPLGGLPYLTATEDRPYCLGTGFTNSNVVVTTISESVPEAFIV